MAVRRALRRIRPDLILLVELELWPNFLAEANRRGIPVAVVNGRVSDRSFPRYRLIRPLVRRWLQRIDVCCVQNETYAERLRQLGAPADRVVVTGNLKFDATPEAPAPDDGLRRDFGLAAEEPLLIGGCTWPGEDEALLAAYRRLKEEFPRLRLLLAPRQAERFDPVERLTREAGLQCVRRTVLQGGMRGDEVPPDAVFLLDTVGELAQVYGLGTVVFVGGSLRPHGGHNIIEPSGLAKAVLFGPHTDNFRDITDDLVACDAAIRVADEAELEAACRRLLADPAAANELGARARRLVDHHRGATERTLDAIERACSIRSG
jgi:3-deoxy-D-manno-octulosonic-acid transferase